MKRRMILALACALALAGASARARAQDAFDIWVNTEDILRELRTMQREPLPRVYRAPAPAPWPPRPGEFVVTGPAQGMPQKR